MVFSMAITFTSSSPRINLGTSRTFEQRKLQCSVSCSSSSAVSTQFDIRIYLTNLTAEINQKLDEVIPVQYPQQIYEAMRYSLLAKDVKRSHPVICVATCELFGGNRSAAIATACALEMVTPPLYLLRLCLE
ncbi:Transferase of alkyl or aryl groups [Sarracenia purpurea var. burkii]